MSAHDSSRRARQGIAEDIAVLVGLYAQLNADGRGQVLIAAAEAMAAQRVHGRSSVDGKPLDPEEWLEALAEGTFPEHEGAARLVTVASDVEIDARTMMFQEGRLGTVLTASEDEESLGEGAYCVYGSIRMNTDAMYRPPTPEDYLCIHVPKDDFEEWHGDERVLNEEAWEAEVRRRCVLQFASMIADWRNNFFEALLAGKQPHVRTEADVVPMPPALELSDLSDDSLDALLDEAMSSPSSTISGTSSLDDIPGVAELLSQLADQMAAFRQAEEAPP